MSVFGFSDAAKRISDTVNQAIVDGHRNRWMAFALEDGKSNGTTYDTRRDAVLAHRNAYRLNCYLQVPWDHLMPRAAEVYLKIHRDLASIGQHPVDDEIPDTQWMLDNRREAYPQLDRRRALVELRTKGGIILP